MNSNRTLSQERQFAGATAMASGLAMKRQWIACVLEEMQQANTVIEKRYGRSRAMWRDDSGVARDN